jgi:hypothetical protein
LLGRVRCLFGAMMDRAPRPAVCRAHINEQLPNLTGPLSQPRRVAARAGERRRLVMETVSRG